MKKYNLNSISLKEIIHNWKKSVNNLNFKFKKSKLIKFIYKENKKSKKLIKIKQILKLSINQNQRS